MTVATIFFLKIFHTDHIIIKKENKHETLKKTENKKYTKFLDTLINEITETDT